MSMLLHRLLASVAPTPTDPTGVTWDKVLFQANFDTKQTVDDSSYQNAMTWLGTTSSGGGRFGNGAGGFNGSHANRIESPYNSRYVFGANEDFTIDFWVYASNVNSSTWLSIAPQFGSGTWSIGYDSGLYFRLWDTNGTVQEVKAGSGWNINQWQHVAITRASGTVRILFNESIMASKGMPQGMKDAGLPLVIGSNSGAGGNAFNGSIDEIRITKGVNRYETSGNYTLPTAAFWRPPAA